MSQQNLLGLASLDPLRESQLLQYHPAYSCHKQKRLLQFFRASYTFLELSFWERHPPLYALGVGTSSCTGLFIQDSAYTLKEHPPGQWPRPSFTLLCAPVCTAASTPAVHNCPEVCTPAVHNSADVCTSWCSTHAVHNLC